jgi:hypothetical protein
MFSKTNIEIEIQKVKKKRTASERIVADVKEILDQNEIERKTIIASLQNSAHIELNEFNFDKLATEHIYHILDIEKLCVDYRLRFLDARYFKGPFPDEAISKIRQLEKDHDTTINGFKVVAPSKLMKLENADDPLLFAPMGNDYYYLIHKWGNDLHPFRKVLMWPYKTFENLVFTVLLISMLLTGITPLQLFSAGNPNQEYLLFFLFVFKGVAGIVLFYGFSKGKNFNKAIWRSKYYNA